MHFWSGFSDQLHSCLAKLMLMDPQILDNNDIVDLTSCASNCTGKFWHHFQGIGTMFSIWIAVRQVEVSLTPTEVREVPHRVVFGYGLGFIVREAVLNEYDLRVVRCDRGK